MTLFDTVSFITVSKIMHELLNKLCAYVSNIYIGLFVFFVDVCANSCVLIGCRTNNLLYFNKLAVNYCSVSSEANYAVGQSHEPCQDEDSRVYNFSCFYFAYFCWSCFNFSVLPVTSVCSIDLQLTLSTNFLFSRRLRVLIKR